MPAEVGDGRRVAVELTEEGNVALWRPSSALEGEGILEGGVEGGGRPEPEGPRRARVSREDVR